MRTRLRCLIVLCALLSPTLVRAQGVTTEPIKPVFFVRARGAGYMAAGRCPR
jgi:hypothetical protein